MIPDAAYWIWGITLGIVTFVITPLALYLLHRGLTAAMSIERYLREGLKAGVGIVENTAAIAALDETIQAATSLLQATELLKNHAADIAETVASPPAGR